MQPIFSCHELLWHNDIEDICAASCKLIASEYIAEYLARSIEFLLPLGRLQCFSIADDCQGNDK